jgi:hypothetical protein
MIEFIPSLATLAAFSLAAIALTLTPGPDMTLFLGQTVANGRRAGFMSMAGASSGIVVHSLAAAIGLSALIAASPQAFEVLKWVGAAYLAYLAYEVLRHGSGLTGDGPPKSNSLRKGLHEGPDDQSSEPEDHSLLCDVPAAIRLAHDPQRFGQADVFGAVLPGDRDPHGHPDDIGRRTHLRVLEALETRHAGFRLGVCRRDGRLCA